ncbi:sugar phosphate isomerase/epimerase family protein [Salidesulfovibrio brasiliensis]|uniref:sugar phosphate isomerase/epimerase family protein n=1 Tax=Salidesulfovibrio brasiliensis TaxID=221711 RepID=UPI0006CFB216|nr:sugar phosphate isomerase/epimerase family protein [Salidesulfovibrio brasiliensis]
MKLAVSNITLPSFDHEDELPELAALGFCGLEVAPSKVWRDTSDVRPRDVDAYRHSIESAGLRVAGLHSLFFDRPDLVLFKDEATTAALMDFMVHLSSICADLGGRTMVFGSGVVRMRNGLPVDEADRQTVDFLGEYAERISGHGTCLVIEALAESVTDYINDLSHARRLIETVNRPEIRGHIDLAAAAWAGDLREDIFAAMAPHLAHVHVSETGLVPLAEGDTVDHALAARLLRAIGYEGFCSLEQRMVREGFMAPVKRSMERLKEHYA